MKCVESTRRLTFACDVREVVRILKGGPQHAGLRGIALVQLHFELAHFRLIMQVVGPDAERRVVRIWSPLLIFIVPILGSHVVV